MSTAGPDNTAWVATTSTLAAPCSNSASAAFEIVPTGVDHVVHEQAGPARHLADDLEHLHQVRHAGIAPLVDDRQRRPEAVRPQIGDPRTRPASGADHGEPGPIDALA